jgi:hypothetical protein
MRSPLIVDALALLAERGLAAEVEQGGAHYKLRFDNQNGCRCLLVVSVSPSSRNALKKNRSQLHRLLRRSTTGGAPSKTQEK